MDIRIAAKVFTIYQPEKVLTPPVRCDIPRLYCLLSRYLNERKAN